MQYEVALRREMEAFGKNLDALCKIRDFWVDTVGSAANAKNPFRGAASRCLYRPEIWHPLFTGIWSLLILIVLITLFQPNYYSEMGVVIFNPWAGTVAAIVVGLMFFAKIQSDRKIKRTVVSLHPSV